MLFEFPKIHSFPPFYTKQRNATILENQLDSWGNLILQYCEFYRIYTLLPEGAILSGKSDCPPLFDEPSIDRSVPHEFRREIFSHMIHKMGRAQPVDKKRRDAGVYILWRLLAEWAKLLYSHVDATGQLGTIMTVYELTKSDESLNEEFLGIDAGLFARILEVLRKQGKAQILTESDGLIGGVKIV